MGNVRSMSWIAGNTKKEVQKDPHILRAQPSEIKL
jgi:hypothetical protein